MYDCTYLQSAFVYTSTLCIQTNESLGKLNRLEKEIVVIPKRKIFFRWRRKRNGHGAPCSINVENYVRKYCLITRYYSYTIENLRNYEITTASLHLRPGSRVARPSIHPRVNFPPPSFPRSFTYKTAVSISIRIEQILQRHCHIRK